MRFRLEGGITMPKALVAVGGAAALAMATVCVGGVLAETEAQKLLASDGVSEDRFGSAVAREGDTLIVGAPQAFFNGLAGSFYVFGPGEEGRWIEEGRVLSPFPGGPYGDEFGAALALDGDSLFVGAPLREDGPFIGRAYAYSRDGNGQWTLDQDFPPPSPRFGQSIALDGDTAVIASDTEAVVLTRAGSDPWSQEALLSADTIGTTVAFDGETIAVGGRFSNLEIGAVTFVKQAGVWSPSAVISMPTTPFLGNPYMLVRDMSIDGDRLALGITNALGPDQVFVYERDASSGDWIEQAVLDPDVVEGDGFGGRVVLQGGDLLLVGATAAGLGGTVYAYRRSGAGEWTEATQLVPSDGFFGKGFGRAIHLAGGIAVVGSGDHDNGLHAGAAYVFGAGLGPSLAVAGSCPGPMSFAVTGATPGGRVAFVYASGEGKVVVPPSRVCAGTELGLDGTARVARIMVADGDGATRVEANVPAPACGRTFVQVVDAETCAPSGVEEL